MAHRKIMQEVDKTFKAVALGVEAFDQQYEKYEQSTNASQRDKLVDNLKRECKKLQRLRDQIKTWAAGNEIKDKAPLLEKRELIETKMEAFKAVEKEQKTKTFSKEGLAASAKLDPKEQEKEDASNFLSEMSEDLGRQIEALEAEVETIQGGTKKTKKNADKAEKVADREVKIEKHRWHINRLDLLRRALLNDVVDAEQVKDVEDQIRYYVESNDEVDFQDDDGIYDEFSLDDEADQYGVHQDVDRVDSHDGQSVQEEQPEPLPAAESAKVKGKQSESSANGSTRRPSQQIKSPLQITNLHNLPQAGSTSASGSMKPAPPPPTKGPGETLRYASAAAAAAASDKGVGIAPLPPAPGATTSSTAPSTDGGNAQATTSVKSSAATSPAVTSAQPSGLLNAVSDKVGAASALRSPVPSHSSIGDPSPAVSMAQLTRHSTRDDTAHLLAQNGGYSVEQIRKPEPVPAQDHDRDEDPVQSPSNGIEQDEQDEQESIFHLPSSLQELVESYEINKNAATPQDHPDHQRALGAAANYRPDTFDAEKPRLYRPTTTSPYTPSHFPQEPLPIFDHPRLYEQIDADSLFYTFYYKQGTYYQYLAAKALKKNSWRFHKQYQTWFQRHEEPKTITEDYEQGTYRFFDYESTWMNRRKQDFKFAYKFLEDDL